MMFRLTTAGAPAWKLALIPILVAVLFKVTRSSSSDVERAETTAATQAETAAAPVAEKHAPAMPERSLADALRFDPFSALALPEKPAPETPVEPELAPVETAPPVIAAEPPAPKVDPLAEKAATLKQLKVSAVFPSAKGAMAIIDSKTVRAGDWLSPGVRVVEIRDHDVLLRVEDGEPAPGKAAGEAAIR
ncbi:MAG TPA: hypothetical protein VM510_07335 [Caulifigura sp.]|nr:hypothetical protein [Caulifigura sp.]